MSITYRIGTRDSQLAMWQAKHIQHLLKKNGLTTVLVPVKSEGDLDLATPLYAMGVQGIFTRSLDQALLNNQIDLAVHSMKDVPVQLPRGIAEAAIPLRDSPIDLLVLRDQTQINIFEKQAGARIASSSLRRKAQWLHRFPQHHIEPIRGNVNTRLKKLSESSWNGAIFAAAGLERIGLRPPNSIELDWMLPAPAQGALLVLCRENDEALLSACSSLHDRNSAFCTHIERDFLSALLGGCSTPVGALAEMKDDEIYFRGNLTSTNGNKQVKIEKTISIDLAASIGTSAARELLEDGGQSILQEIKND